VVVEAVDCVISVFGEEVVVDIAVELFRLVLVAAEDDVFCADVTGDKVVVTFVKASVIKLRDFDVAFEALDAKIETVDKVEGIALWLPKGAENVVAFGVFNVKVVADETISETLADDKETNSVFEEDNISVIVDCKDWLVAVAVA
jgi:hypothetical protein